MEASNPYQTPQADVNQAQEYQTPKLFAFKSRIGRMQYFAYSIVYSFIAMFLALSIGAIVDGSASGPTSSILIMIAIIPVYVVAMKRRLNDLGRTGWLSLIGFIPLIGGLFGLYLLFAPGELSENKYGLPPAKSGKGPTIVIAVIVGLFVLGIVAAIAIPAYQSYTERANAVSVSQ